MNYLWLVGFPNRAKTKPKILDSFTLWFQYEYFKLEYPGKDCNEGNII